MDQVKSAFFSVLLSSCAFCSMACIKLFYKAGFHEFPVKFYVFAPFLARSIKSMSNHAFDILSILKCCQLVLVLPHASSKTQNINSLKPPMKWCGLIQAKANGVIILPCWWMLQWPSNRPNWCPSINPAAPRTLTAVNPCAHWRKPHKFAQCLPVDQGHFPHGLTSWARVLRLRMMANHTPSEIIAN